MDYENYKLKISDEIELKVIYKHEIRTNILGLASEIIMNMMTSLKKTINHVYGMYGQYSAQDLLDDNTDKDENIDKIKKYLALDDLRAKKIAFKELLTEDKSLLDALPRSLREATIRYVIDEYLTEILTDEEKLFLEVTYAL